MSSLEMILTGALDVAVAYGLVVGLAAVGEMLTERAGVLNLGLEGVVLIGAFGGFALAYVTGNPWMGMLGGALSGAALGAVMSLWSVTLKTEQVINGILLFMIASGLTTMLNKEWFMTMAEPPRVEGFKRLSLPVLGQIPVLGPVLFSRPLSSYLAIALIAAVAWLLYRTRFGLITRACGETPKAVDFSGVYVDRYRFIVVILGCALAGVAGALLSVEQLKLFAPGLSAGRGWIALSIVIVGGWHPLGCVLAALLFGVTDMLQFQFQGKGLVPYEFLLALPYVVAIAALAFRRQTVRAPGSLAVPFRK
jgi:ABC-type uncharacterized transport system permease subunit